MLSLPRAVPVHAAPTPGAYYVALGDSLGYGYTNDQTPLDPQCASATAIGYVCVFYRYLKTLNPAIQLTNLSVPGADSCDMLYGYPGPANQCTHKPTPGNAPSQVDAAVALLKAHPGQVNPITINIGGDDILPLLPQGVTDLAGTAAKLPGIFQNFQANLDKALSEIKAADPKVTVILVTQYNPLAGLPTDQVPQGFAPLAQNAIDSLNTIITAEAQKYGYPVADVAAAFAAQPGKGTPLTNVPATIAGGLAAVNTHPLAAGYQLMGQVVINTYAAIGVPLSAVPARPQLVVHLATGKVRTGHVVTVTGRTEAGARLSIRVRAPGHAAALRHAGNASSSGTFRWSFPAGSRRGAGSVRVCATGVVGLQTCSAGMTYRVR
jgi:lysophospholipase L1-like esterase